MKKWIETISQLIPFLEPYPNWVKAVIWLWLLCGAFILGALVFVPRKPEIPQPPTGASKTMEPEVKAMADLRDWAINSDSTLPLTLDRQTIRNNFINVWQDPGRKSDRYSVDPEMLMKAFETQIQICRDEEVKNFDRPNGHFWADEAIEHFRSKAEWAPWQVKALACKLRVFYDQVQSDSANFNRRRPALELGLKTARDAQIVIQNMTAEQLEKVGANDRAAILRITSSMRYEFAKPEDSDERGWNVDQLRVALEEAKRSAEFNKERSLVPRLRVLHRLMQERPAEYETVATQEMEALKAEVKKIYDERTSPDRSIAPLNNFAMLVHNIVVQKSSRTKAKKDVEALLALHREHALLYQERVVTHVETPGAWQEAVERKGDFLFDLARIRAQQAAMLTFLGRTQDADLALSQMDDALVKIDRDQSISNALRKRLLVGLLRYAEFAPHLKRPKLKSLADYARQQ